MKRLKNYFFYIVVILVIVNLYQSFGILNNTIIIEFVFSLALLIITFYIYYKKFSFPLFPLYHFLLFLVYVFPVIYFNYLKNTWAFNTTALKNIYSENLAVQVILIFIFMQIISLIQVTFTKKMKCKPSKMSYKLKKNSAIIMIVFILIFVSMQMLVKVDNLPLIARQLFLLIRQLLYIPIGILLFQYLNNKNKNARNVLMISLLIYLILLITKAAAAPFAELALFIVIIIYHKGMKIHWSIYFAGISFIAFIMDFKMSIRVLYHNSNNSSLYEKIIEISHLFIHTINSSSDLWLASLNFLLIRAQMLSTFMIVVGNTPSVIKYWKFSQLQDLFWGFIPRFVYPFKPILNEGQNFGHAYSIIGANDFVTAINIPSLVGFYMAFGLSSLIVGIIIFNFIMLKIAKIAKGAYYDEPMIITLAYFSLNFIHNIDTGYTGIGTLFYKTLIFYFVARFLYKKLLIKVSR